MYPKSYVKKCALLCGFSISLFIFGTVLIYFRTIFYKALIRKIFLLQPGSQAYDVWKKNPMPMELKLYLFNWTNAADMLNSSTKPQFQEVGPYTFEETKEKVNITWNENNNTVSFYHLKKWWFNSTKSNGSLSDPITSVNPIALSSAVAAKNWFYPVKKGMDVFFSAASTSVHTTHLAGEILFDGYEDELLTIARNMPSIGAPSLPDYDKFGWFYSRNNSETFEGHFNMDTGVTGQLGELYTWKFMNHTPYYPGGCGEISGSAGEFFPTNLRTDSIIKFFSADLCRYAELEFEKEVVINGVLGYKYSAGDRFLDNGTKVPENKCFCNGDCMPSGALDISACRYGSPAYVSLPHFYKADPYYGANIDGVRPNGSRHDFFMIFEPKTGMPLQVSARLQLNLLLQPVSHIAIFESVPEIYVPVLWFEQSVLMPDDFLFYLTILINLEIICLVTGIICVCVSVLTQTCFLYRLCTSSCVKRGENYVIPEQVPLKYQKSIFS